MNIQLLRAMGGLGGGGSRIPFKFDSILWLDGAVLQDESTYYLLDKSGNSRHFLITDYDFPENLAGGFPYKSAATVSAPIGDATLIAADVNNFLYDSGGNPNQIPVVSFFQNVDYANRLFCRHQDQLLDVNGVETFEPRVREIVLYANAKTGAELEKCNSYFKVPEKNATAKYVPSDYLTNTAAITALGTGAVIYNKTGNYTEISSSNNLRLDKQNKVTALGRVTIKRNAGATYLVVATGITLLENLILDAETINGFSFTGDNNLVKKSLIKNVKTTGFVTLGAGTNTKLENCIINAINVLSFTNSANLIIDTCFIKCTFDAGMLGYNINSGGKHVVKNSRIITTKGSGASTIIGQSNTVAGNGIKDVDFINNTVSIDQNAMLFNFGNSADQGTINILKNKFYINKGDTAYNISYIPADRNKTGVFYNIENNLFKINDNVGRGLYFDTIRGLSYKNNAFQSNYALINFSHPIESATFSGNSIFALLDLDTNLGFSGICVGRSTDTGVTIPVVIEKNNIKNPRYFGQEFGNHDCIYTNNMPNVLAKYNNCAGAGISNYIFRNDIAASSAQNGCFYNISYLSGILSKGLSNFKIYGNTVINSNRNGIMLMSAVDGSRISTNIVKNNIVVDYTGVGHLVAIENELTSARHIIDYNVYYSTREKPFLVDNVEYTFAEWQALGYDAHSVFVDPQISYAQPWPTSPITIGENLGTDYNTGLDITTNWGSATTVPSVVTKQQGANWQVGAYVQ